MDFGVNFFVDARHAQHDGRAYDAHIFLQQADVAVEGHEIADAERKVVRSETLKRVRKGKKREPDLVDARTDATQNAVDVRENRTVREHHSLGFARCA